MTKYFVKFLKKTQSGIFLSLVDLTCDVDYCIISYGYRIRDKMMIYSH